MIRKPNKGDYGYIRDYKKYRGIVSLIWLVLIAAVYVSGIVVFDTNKNYVTILAILLVLPAAKAWVAFFVMLPYHTQPRELYDTVCELMAERGAKIYSDMVITRYEGAMQLSIVVIYDDNYYVMIPKQKKSAEDVRKYLNEMLIVLGLTTKAQVFEDEKKYQSAIQKLAQGPELESRKTAALAKKLLTTAL